VSVKACIAEHCDNEVICLDHSGTPSRTRVLLPCYSTGSSMILPLTGVLSSAQCAQLDRQGETGRARACGQLVVVADKAAVDQRKPVPLHAYV
jgi:hypothetical protein